MPSKQGIGRKMIQRWVLTMHVTMFCVTYQLRLKTHTAPTLSILAVGRPSKVIFVGITMWWIYWQSGTWRNADHLTNEHRQCTWTTDSWVNWYASYRAMRSDIHSVCVTTWVPVTPHQWRSCVIRSGLKSTDTLQVSWTMPASIT